MHIEEHFKVKQNIVFVVGASVPLLKNILGTNYSTPGTPNILI